MGMIVHAMPEMIAVDRGADFFDRALRAADVYWQVDNLCVAMPIFDSQEACGLRSVLQSIGLTVFNGMDHIPCEDFDYFLESEQSVVMIFHASDWRSAAAFEKACNMREIFPAATICVVTELLSLPDPCFYPRHTMFRDARALLQAAGIGFFSVEGESDELRA